MDLTFLTLPWLGTPLYLWLAFLALVTLLLAFDLCQLSALLFITGGLANPFAPLVCVPVIISSSLQPIRFSLPLGLLSVFGITALASVVLASIAPIC